MTLDSQSFPGGSDSKESARSVGDLGSIPRSGRSPGERYDNPLQYSYLENPKDKGAWWATIYRVTKSQTWLNNWHFHFWTHRFKGVILWHQPLKGNEEIKIVEYEDPELTYSTNTSKSQVHIEQLLLRMTWRLSEQCFYNQDDKERTTELLEGGEEKQPNQDPHPSNWPRRGGIYIGSVIVLKGMWSWNSQ